MSYIVIFIIIMRAISGTIGDAELLTHTIKYDKNNAR